MHYQAFLTSLILLSLGQASPTGSPAEKLSQEDGPYKPVHGGKSPDKVTADQISEFELYSQYAAAAACPSNNNGNDTKITCNTGNCPRVEKAGAVGIYEFENTFFTDLTGYVAVSELEKTIVVAFRGTKSLANIIANTALIQTPYPNCDGCMVHLGYYGSYHERHKEIAEVVEKASKSHPDYKVVVTGHSLGGALAVFAAADLRTQGFKAALYTFGQPRVGNDQFNAYLEANPGSGNFRITLGDDRIPKFPLAIFEYNHFSPEFWITTDNPKPSPSDIGVYKGRYNVDGNLGTDGPNNSTAHIRYFGEIAKCAPETDKSI